MVTLQRRLDYCRCFFLSGRTVCARVKEGPDGARVRVQEGLLPDAFRSHLEALAQS
jgi:hypothetical protein